MTDKDLTEKEMATILNILATDPNGKITKVNSSQKPTPRVLNDLLTALSEQVKVTDPLEELISLEAIPNIEDANISTSTKFYIIPSLATLYAYQKEINSSNHRTKNFIELLLSGVVDHYFDSYYTKEEGSACSHDKTNFTIRMILKQFKTSTDQSLYDEYDDETKLSGKAYWSPKTIETSNEAIDKFNSWYYFK